MLRRQKNSRKQGDVGLGIAIGWFAKNGYTVCVPLTDNQDYDLVVELEDGLQRVQVKTSTLQKKSGSWQVELRTKGGNKSGTGKTKFFDAGGVDYLFVLTEDDQRFLIPTEHITNRSALLVGEKSYREFKVS